MKRREETTITILIAEPLSIVRAGLRALLTGEAGFEVVGETGKGADLVNLVRRLRPDILVLEPGLPGPPPSQLLTEARAIHPGLRALILASPQDELTTMALFETGAVGCFLKSDRPEELLRGIRAAAAGELSTSAAVARWLLKRLTGYERHSPVDPLTDREREILDHLTAGLSNKEIAQKLYLSVRTVEVHLRNIYGKLGVRSRLEAVTRTMGHSRPVLPADQVENK